MAYLIMITPLVTFSSDLFLYCMKIPLGKNLVHLVLAMPTSSPYV